MARGMALTAQQRAFVTAYLDGGMTNAAEAYRVAYPTSRSWKAQRVAEEASVLLSNPKISPIIAEARAKAAASLVQAADRFAVSKERISAELARMAFADSRRLFSWSDRGVTVIASAELTDDDAAAVVEVSQTVTSEGGTIRVKLGDKRQALMDLAKLHGHIIDKAETNLLSENLHRVVSDAPLTNEDWASKYSNGATPVTVNTDDAT